MAITKNVGRQEVIAARVSIVGTETVTTVLDEAVDLPEGAIVVGGYVEYASFAGGADMTLTVSGGGASTAAIDVDAADGLTELTFDGSVAAQGGDTVDVTLGGTQATAGVATLVVQYIVNGRAAFSEG